MAWGKRNKNRNKNRSISRSKRSRISGAPNTRSFAQERPNVDPVSSKPIGYHVTPEEYRGYRVTPEECRTVKWIYGLQPSHISPTDRPPDNLVCHPTGTKISTKDGYKNIEDISPGDKILTYNESTSEVEEKKTSGSDRYMGDDKLITITHDFGKVSSTIGHPFLVVNKGWCAHNPYPDLDALSPVIGIDFKAKLSEGDLLFHLNDDSEVVESKIHSIEIFDKNEIEVYKVSNVEDNHTFFANGVVSHNVVTTILDIVRHIAEG